MKQLLLVFAVMVLALGTKAQQTSPQITPYTVDEILTRASSSNPNAGDTIYVINFWSTYCAPCVAELHEFNSLEKKYVGQPVKVILVSIDFKDDFEKGKLATFVQRKHLTPEINWLNETDPNEFIPKIDKSWEGSIPCTLMTYPAKQQRQFLEGTITANRLKHIADKWRQ